MRTKSLWLLCFVALLSCSAAGAATCSNSSLNGTYGFLHGDTNSSGAPISAAVSQLTFDSSTGTFTGATTSSRDGVLTTFSFTGAYTVAANCIGVGTPTGGNPFSFAITPNGFVALEPYNPTLGATSQGYAVKQGAANCSNAGVEGSFAFATNGITLAGAPTAGPLALIAELTFSVRPSGDAVVSGIVTGSEGTSLTYSDKTVTGSYSVNANCTGTLTITPKGESPLNFSFVVVHSGKKMLAIETDANTLVTATLVKDSTASMNARRDLPSGTVRLPQLAELNAVADRTIKHACVLAANVIPQHHVFPLMQTTSWVVQV